MILNSPVGRCPAVRPRWSIFVEVTLQKFTIVDLSISQRSQTQQLISKILKSLKLSFEMSFELFEGE